MKKTIIMTFLGCSFFTGMNTINAGIVWGKPEVLTPDEEVQQVLKQAKRIPLFADMFQKAESGTSQEQEQARAQLLGIAQLLTELAQKKNPQEAVYCQNLGCFKTQEECTDHK